MYDGDGLVEWDELEHCSRTYRTTNATDFAAIFVLNAV